jgi:hypothetical protein
VYDGIKVVAPFKRKEAYKNSNQDEPGATFLHAAATIDFATGF